MRRPTHAVFFVAALVLVSSEVVAEPLTVSAAEAVARALKRNLELEVARRDAALSVAPELTAEASFEPLLFASLELSRSPGSVSAQRAGLQPVSSTSVSGSVGVKKAFSTGTSVDLTVSSGGLFGAGGLDPAYQSSVALTLRQALLNGVSKAANEAAITAARLDRSAAQHTLSYKAELIARDTLSAYFDLHAALAADEVQRLAVANAERTHADTKTLIASGKVAGSEEISARYAVAVQQRAKLETERAIADARDKLARLMGLVTPRSLATPALVTTPSTTPLPAPAALVGLQRVALARRGDLLAAEKSVERWRSQLQAARHKLLPKLDLQGSVYATGLSGDLVEGTTASIPSGYASSYEMDRVGFAVGLVFELPLGNRAAKGALEVARSEARRAEAQVRLVQQTISQELNLAWRALRLAVDELELSRSAEKVAHAKLDVERERFRAGKTTAHILATVEAELLTEQQAGVQAQAKLSKALATLHAAAGDLLERMRVRL